jgi:L-ascorbate metabolism protein UlaG (beta-lactamase superfamily)
VRISYLGNAGWQIEDGKKVILADPFITEFRKEKKDEQQITADEILPLSSQRIGTTMEPSRAPRR